MEGVGKVIAGDGVVQVYKIKAIVTERLLFRFFLVIIITLSLFQMCLLAAVNRKTPGVAELVSCVFRLTLDCVEKLAK